MWLIWLFESSHNGGSQIAPGFMPHLAYAAVTLTFAVWLMQTLLLLWIISANVVVSKRSGLLGKVVVKTFRSFNKMNLEGGEVAPSRNHDSRMRALEEGTIRQCA